jgi:hypothetical protein
MNLYLKELNKAVSPPNVGRDTVPERRSVASYQSSYAEQPVGVLGGSHTPDSPEVGKDWKRSKEYVVDELEEDRDALDAEAVDSGVVRKQEVNKSLSMLAQVNDCALDILHKLKPNETEIEFLTEVLGYTHEDVNKGLARIVGRDRSLFNEWVCERLHKSVAELRGLK